MQNSDWTDFDSTPYISNEFLLLDLKFEQVFLSGMASVTGWNSKPLPIGYVVRKFDKDFESVLGLVQFGHFPWFLGVKSFRNGNHFFLQNLVYINFTKNRNFRSNEVLENTFEFILFIQNS